MNDSIKRISLDIHNAGSGETVNAKRGDTARKIIVSLVDGGLPYIIGEDCYAVFTAKKPDGKVVYNDCTIKDNTIIYKFTEQTVAVEGKVNCEIKLYGADDKLITSPKFTIVVFGTVYNEGDEVESSDEFSALTKLISDTIEVNEAAIEATENANEATLNANEAAAKAIQTAKSLMVVGKTWGTDINLDDAIEQTFVGLRIFGKTTQDGTPTPDAPVDLVSVGDSGSIVVNVEGENDAQNMIVATPNGLLGIPVASGGNYTDTNGKQWICDEVDLERGMRVQRCFEETVTLPYDAANNRYIGTLTYKANEKFVIADGIIVICDKLKFNGATVSGVNGVRVSPYNTNYVIAYYNGEDPGELNLVYPLATPIETPLSEEELTAYAALHTYRDNTTVSNDAGAYMELEYVMNAKKYIDSQISTGIINARVG